MRPLRLEFQALGAFPGKVEIDFAALGQRGLFVVSGDTGTGKTTIFDAMCYALYGKMPSKDKSEIRSHHVEPGDETYVLFEFESVGRRYCVRRRPEQPKKPRQQSALLERATEDGGTEAMETQWANVGKACASIVGLDANQFMRVVLLPQGEFAQFLFANSGERESLLKKLFGGEIFQRLVDELKQQAKEAHGNKKSAQVKVDERIGALWRQVCEAHKKLNLDLPASWETKPPIEEYDHELAEDTLAGLRKHVEQIKQEVDDAKDEENAARTAKEAADASAKRFDEFESASKTRAELEVKRSEVDQARASTEASAQARPVVIAASAVEKREGEYKDAAEERNSRFQELEVCLEIPERTLSAVNAAVSALGGQLQEQQSRLEKVAEARTARGEAKTALEEAENEVKDTEAKLEKLEALIADMEGSPHDPSALRVELGKLEQERNVATERLKAKRKLDALIPDLEKAERALDGAKDEWRRAWNAFVETQAPRLAQGLAAGERCPVCGSAEHPQPAHAGDVRPVGIEFVNAKQTVVDRCTAEYQEFKKEWVRLEQQLGDAVSSTVQALEDRSKKASAAYEKQEKAVKEAEKSAKALKSAGVNKTDFESKLSSVTATMDHAKNDFKEAEQACLAAVEEASGIDVKELEAKKARLARATEAQKGLEGLVEGVARAKASLESAREHLKQKRDDSPFESEDAARQAVLTESEERARKSRVKQFDEDWVRCNGELARLQKEGVPGKRPDTDAAKTQLDGAHAKLVSLQSIHAVGGAAVHTAEEGLESLTRGFEELDDAHDVHKKIDKVATVCQRGGNLRMPLPRWALAHELDRVTAAGNVHLDRMTSGRYALRRCVESRDGRKLEGLELEVLDAHTGKPRSTKSLSGGEQFQASLALALGLADVVSHGGTSSGRSFDALFVDEGFGSLDPRALDEAVEALHQIHASGRMVGAITHVEAMKQQLHVGIEVRRRDDGAGSVLEVRA